MYGIGHGARYYFDKPASTMTPRESAFLAAMLPGPQKVHNPYRHLDRVLKRSDTILWLLRKKGVLNRGNQRGRVYTFHKTSYLFKKATNRPPLLYSSRHWNEVFVLL